MKILKWAKDNFLFVFTLFLLGFIPLYPKIPLLDVVNTWVYVRAEDFVIALAAVIWSIMLAIKKVSLKTPLTIPIFIFWIVGGLSTLHGVLLIFPTLSDVFPNVAFLSFMRRIEYMFLFFVAFTSIRDKKYINYAVYALTVIVILIAGYGMGQKYLGFPAYLTMNEEFAKGIPIQLSSLSRVPSTFAGHYDLAAYLVLTMPILISVFFAFKNWFMRIFLAVSIAMGFALMVMTVSRVSFFVLLLSMAMLLFLQKKRLIILSLFTVAFLFLSLFPSLLSRFGNTLKEVTVLVDSETGAAIGQIRETNRSYFENKIVKKHMVTLDKEQRGTSSAILPFYLIPQNPILLVEANEPTGEDLPQGTGYVNLPLSPILRRESQFFFEKANQSTATAEVQVFFGDYVIKKAYAYDLSFTTRFQGEWPKAIAAFKRNIFLGSGYASVTLAVDNNYLRILGESGLLGFISFFSIFLVAGLYMQKVLPKVDSRLTRSFVLGFFAGTFGLMLNAIFIDVFEASKVAFTYWLLMGITLGILSLYKTWHIDMFGEFKKALVSPCAIIIYLFAAAVALYFPASSYYFTGDDFTWFRWAENSKLSFSSFVSSFTDAHGFFYRPGTKIYFSLMYAVFWLNQAVYHFVSFTLHFGVAVLIFLISKRIWKNYFLAVGSAFLFLILSGHQEAVFWISSTGFLFNAFFAFLSLLSFIYWRERKRKVYIIVSFISAVLGLSFHELGIMTPFLIIAYDGVFGSFESKRIYKVFLLPIIPYLVLRFAAHSHWFSGDYSYNLFKLPFNFVGNAIGYFALFALGPASTPIYNALRSFGREHMVIAFIAAIAVILIFTRVYKMFSKKTADEEKKIIIFSLLFFVISLLPFLGLGNISSRYSYLSSFGAVLSLLVFAKSIYSYLVIYGRGTAALAVTVAVIIFFSAQLFQLQKVHGDWQAAGNISRRFLVSLNKLYTESYRKDHVQFFFVDPPIRHGEAWIFPVGIEDALWLTFRNANIAVSTRESLIASLEYALTSAIPTRVFQFDKNNAGEFKEINTAYLKEINR